MRVKSPPTFNHWIFLVVVASALLQPVAGTARAQTPPALTRRTLVHRGVTRTWFEHLPAGYDGSRPLPLVLALHGFNNRGDQFAPLSEWAPAADAAGFLVVFPNGGLTVNDNFGWNDFVFNGEQPDDVGFLLTLIQRLESDYPVDPARVFMTGFSNGGSVTHTFAGQHAGVLAAIAPVSGDWLTGSGVPESAMHPDAPLPVWIWGGQNETFRVGSEPLDQQERESVRWWVGFNGNNPTPATTVDGPLTTSVYPDGRAEVRFTVVTNGEHVYQPGTSARIWSDFFSRLSRGSPAPTPTPTPTPAPTPTPTPTPTPSPTPTPIPTPPPPPVDLPLVYIQAEVPLAYEAGRVSGYFLVTRDGSDLSTDLIVTYAVGGQAIGGIQYKPLRGTVTLPAGSATARIKVKPYDDGVRTGDLNVKVSLLPAATYRVGEPPKAKVRIIDAN